MSLAEDLSAEHFSQDTHQPSMLRMHGDAMHIVSVQFFFLRVQACQPVASYQVTTATTVSLLDSLDTTSLDVAAKTAPPHRTQPPTHLYD